MEPNYVYLLDCACGLLRIIKLTAKEIEASNEYEDFENFLYTLEDEYDFKLDNCSWMVTEKLEIVCRNKDEEFELNLKI